MCKSNRKFNTGRLAGHDHAVSEIVGSTLLLGIIMAGTGFLILTGTVIINDAQSSATLNGVEQAFTMADSRLSKARYSTAIFQEAPFEISSGLVCVNESRADSQIVIVDFDNITKAYREIYNQSLGTITCDTGDGIVAYQDGGVWLLDSTGGSLMLSPPDFDYNGVTLTLPIMRISGNATMGTTGGNKVHICVNSTDPVSIYPGAIGSNPVPANHTINVTIKSDYYMAWADYINERTNAQAVIDAPNKSVNVSLRTGKGRQTGLAGGGYNTKSMDTAFNAPTTLFTLNLDLRNTGNDYTITYRVKPNGPGVADPDFQISITRTTGSGNKDYNYIKMYFKQGTRTEVFDTYAWFQRKSEDELDVDLLNRSIMLNYSGSSPSITWGDDPSVPDSSDIYRFEYVDPTYRDVTTGEPKSMYDVVQHYIRYMSEYDQAHGGSLGGPTYFTGSNNECKIDEDSTFQLEYDSSQDIKYLYITEGILNTNLASSN